MNKGVIALVNQKGGVAKTTSCINLGIGLRRHGKKVLLVDFDPQASLTISLGTVHPELLLVTLTDLLGKIVQEKPFIKGDSVIHHPEGIDLIPSNISLAGMDVSLVNVMSRERTLKELLSYYKKDYDYILIDCMPSLGMLTVNALVAADRVIIPTQANYLAVKGLDQLLHSISRVRRHLNTGIEIEGILLTMVDQHTVNARDISASVRRLYDDNIVVFDTEIPRSVRAAEASMQGKSIFAYDPLGKVAEAYDLLTMEVLAHEQQRQRFRSCFIQ